MTYHTYLGENGIKGSGGEGGGGFFPFSLLSLTLSPCLSCFTIAPGCVLDSCHSTLSSISHTLCTTAFS